VAGCTVTTSHPLVAPLGASASGITRSDHCLGTTGDTELRERGRRQVVDGLDGESELGGDGGVRQPTGEMVYRLALTPRELGEWIDRGVGGRQLRQDVARDSLTEDGLAGAHGGGGPSQHGVHSLDVWETKEDLERFFSERMTPT
jgi:hypothetical protein